MLEKIILLWWNEDPRYAAKWVYPRVRAGREVELRKRKVRFGCTHLEVWHSTHLPLQVTLPVNTERYDMNLVKSCRSSAVE